MTYGVSLVSMEPAEDKIILLPLGPNHGVLLSSRTVSYGFFN